MINQIIHLSLHWCSASREDSKTLHPPEVLKLGDTIRGASFGTSFSSLWRCHRHLGNRRKTSAPLVPDAEHLVGMSDLETAVESRVFFEATVHQCENLQEKIWEAHKRETWSKMWVSFHDSFHAQCRVIWIWACRKAVSMSSCVSDGGWPHWELLPHLGPPLHMSKTGSVHL